MFAVAIDRQNANTLAAYCAAVEAQTRPGSRAQNAFRGDLLKIVRNDHDRMMLAGLDRFGRPRAALAKRTLENRKRGPGPSLIPGNRASRFFTNYRVAWADSGGVGVLTAGFDDITSKDGRSIVRYHLDGATRPGTKWVLPARDVGGITPEGLAEAKVRFARLPDDVRRFGGGR